MRVQDLLPKHVHLHGDGLAFRRRQPEEDEVIETKFFPLSAAVRMVMAGRIHDGKTIAGVLWLSHAWSDRTKQK